MREVEGPLRFCYPVHVMYRVIVRNEVLRNIFFQRFFFLIVSSKCTLWAELFDRKWVSFGLRIGAWIWAQFGSPPFGFMKSVVNSSAKMWASSSGYWKRDTMFILMFPRVGVPFLSLKIWSADPHPQQTCLFLILGFYLGSSSYAGLLERWRLYLTLQGPELRRSKEGDWLRLWAHLLGSSTWFGCFLTPLGSAIYCS